MTLWNLATRRAVARIPAPPGGFPVFSPDGKTLAVSVWMDRSVQLWHIPTRRNIATLRRHWGWIGLPAFSPDGRSLAWGGSNGDIQLWDLATKLEVATLRGHEAAVDSLAFSPDGNSLVSGSQDRTVKLWDLPRETMASSRTEDRAYAPTGSDRSAVSLRGHTGQVHGVSFSPDGRVLATGSEDQTVKGL